MARANRALSAGPASLQDALQFVLRRKVPVTCIPDVAEDAPPAWSAQGVIFVVTDPRRDERSSVAALMEQFDEVSHPTSSPR